MINKLMKKIQESKLFVVFATIVFLGITTLQYFCIEVTCRGFARCLSLSPIYIITGVLTVVMVDAVLLLLIKRISIAKSVSILMTTILAVVNFYVYKLHGAPFTLGAIKNAKTAGNVLAAYTIKLEYQIAFICIVATVSVFITVFTFYKKICKRVFSSILTVVMAVFAFFVYFGSNPLVPVGAIGWSWDEAIYYMGYLPSFVRGSIDEINAVKEPNNYDEDALIKYVSENTNDKVSGYTPDVIFILNETLYDLNTITDVGVDSLEYIHSMDNTIQGYAVVPGVGGGTNRSEYEFITSNSLQNTPSVTPFNVFNLTGANSIATYMNYNGYRTVGAHTESESSYQRGEAYDALGFETTYFEDDFTEKEYYYNRWFETDESVYKNLLNWYEGMGEEPRFIYLLTIQNHGDYVSNSAENNFVKTSKDYGENTARVDEFLTSIKMSDNAFMTLTDYYKNSERDVIICMVGDHAPSFAGDIVDEAFSEEEKALRLRSVPYVIWSNNIDLEGYSAPEYMSMIYLAPAVLDAAGMELNGFYSYMNELRQEVPVLSSYGMYITDNGDMYAYSETSEHSKKIDRYFAMVYANMSNKEFMKLFAY